MIHKHPLWISFLLTMLLVPPLHGAAEEFPSIGQLETREYLIVIHSSPAGILYTIKTHEGEIIEHQLSEQLLAALYPQLHESLQRGIADPSQETPELPPLP